MLRKLFETFYEKGISPIAKEIVEKNPGLTYRENIDGVYEEYLNQKTLLRTLLKKSPENEADALLDGHKVAACVTCAIIKVRLITCNKIEDDEIDSAYSLEKALRMNEQLAMFSGLNCLMRFMMENDDNLYLDDSEKRIVDLTQPTTFYPERSEYWSSLIRALYYTNVCTAVNPLLLANIYFLLDAFHRKSVELAKLKRTQQNNHSEDGVG